MVVSFIGGGNGVPGYFDLRNIFYCVVFISYGYFAQIIIILGDTDNCQLFPIP